MATCPTPNFLMGSGRSDLVAQTPSASSGLPLHLPVNAADYMATTGTGPGGPNLLELEAAAQARPVPRKRRGASAGAEWGAADLGPEDAGANALQQASREQFKLNAIEVASFLEEVQAASRDINETTALEKPHPVEQRPGQTRRTGSGTVYPIASPFVENSNVGICMVLPAELEQGSLVLDLEQFFWRCPLDNGLTCLRWGERSRGEPQKKKAKVAVDGAKAKGSNKFDHCCFVSISLPNGFHHVNVKVFKSGRLQTAGCRDGAMSLKACQLVASCIARIAVDGYPEPLLQCGPMHRHRSVDPKYLQELCQQAPANVRLEKESVLGVFDLGFKERGFNVDMLLLRSLLKHPDNKDRVFDVNEPKADVKDNNKCFPRPCERFHTNLSEFTHSCARAHTHTTHTQVKRFQGLGVYVNQACLQNASNNVFVNIFPTGKCTVTAANSRQQAEEVAEVIAKLIIDCFVQCRRREVEEQPKKRRAAAPKNPDRFRLPADVLLYLNETDP